MKKKIALLFISFCLLISKSFAQPSAGVYFFMTDRGITTGAGNPSTGHPDEFELLSVENGFLTPVGSAPVVSELVITKSFNISSLRMQNFGLTGGGPGSRNCEIRYYDGSSASPVYRIKLSTISITSYSGVNSTCVTCPDITEQYSIKPIIIEWRNEKVTPNQVLTYNIQTGQITFSNN